MRKKMGLRARLLVFLLAPMVLVLAVTNYISYKSSYDELDRETQQTMLATTRSFAMELDGWMREKEALVNNQAALLAQRKYSDAELAALLATAQKASRGVSAAVFCAADGRAVDQAGLVYTGAKKAPWYDKAAAADSVVYTDLYDSDLSKAKTVALARAVKSGGQVLGVLAMELDINVARAITAKLKIGDAGYGFVLSDAGLYLAHPRFPLGELSKSNLIKIYKQKNEGTLKVVFEGIERFNAYAKVGNSGWVIVSTVIVDDVFKEANSLHKRNLAISIVGLLALIAVIYYIVNNLIGLIRPMTVAAENIAKGDLAADAGLALKDSGDEIGALGRNFAVMRENLKGIVSEVSQSARQITASARGFSDSSAHSASSSKNVASAVAAISEGAKEQLKSIEGALRLTEDISRNMEKSAQDAQEAARLAGESVEKADAGRASVDKAVQQMDNINAATEHVSGELEKVAQSSNEITRMVDVISAIAGQTNLLALNAAIEAARAGEAGRGFAVVAEEVRTLAENSRDAAAKITELVTANKQNIDAVMQAMAAESEDVKTGMRVVDEAGGSFAEIAALVAKASGQIREISGSLKGMAEESRQIASAVEKIDGISKEAAGQTRSVDEAMKEQVAAAEEISAASRSLADMAKSLEGAVSRFKL